MTTALGNILKLAVALLACSAIYAEPVKLIPNTSNSNYTPSTTELVTIGIPFAPCTLIDLKRFRLLDNNNAEVAVFVKETLYWPDTKGCGFKSTRAIKVQFVMNATVGNNTYSWDLEGRNTSNDRAERPVKEVESSIPNRAGYNEPAVFGILDPAYLVTAQLTPPTTPATDNTFDDNYYPAKFSLSVVNGVSFTNPVRADWLLDTTSTIYKQAIRRGELEQYRQAYLNHEFHMSHFIVTPTAFGTYNPSATGSCPGDWSLVFTGPQRCSDDAKIIYTEPQKLHLALTGDDSWVPPSTELVSDMKGLAVLSADLLFDGSERTLYTGSSYIPAHGGRLPYTSRDAFYTERGVGIGLITNVNSCELTHDPHICEHADILIDNIYSHNIDEYNVWPGLPYTGYNKHSWVKHEAGAQQAWVGLVSRIDGPNTYTVSGALGSADSLVVGTPLQIPTTVHLTKQVELINGMYIATVDHPVGDKLGDGAPINLVPGAEFFSRALPLSPAEPYRFRVAGGTEGKNGYPQSHPIQDPLLVHRVKHTVTSPVVDNGDGTWTITTNIGTDRIDIGAAVVVSGASGFPDTDQGFSPWMSSILMDGLWQYYHWTDDEVRKKKAAFVILGFARANIAFGIDGSTTPDDTVAVIEAAFSGWPDQNGVKIRSANSDWETRASLQNQPLPRYAANHFMSAPNATNESITAMAQGGYQRQHLPELVFAMALGMYFETDPAKKAAMALVAEQATRWFDHYETTVARGAIRSFPWQLRSDPYGTLQFVRSVQESLADVPPKPPVKTPPGNTKTQAGSSSIKDLKVLKGANVVNLGRIYNLTNDGNVRGGILGGLVRNTGTLENVTLEGGTRLSGGLITGSLSGVGTITDAVLDITQISDGIVLGAGVRITSDSVHNLAGVNLSSVVMDKTGKIDLDTPILINEDSIEISVRDIVIAAIDANFQNGETDILSASEGQVTIVNQALANLQVAVIPTFVTTSHVPDGIRMSDTGNFQVTNDGVLVEFVPAASNQDSFEAGLQAIGAMLDKRDAGLMQVNFSGSNFLFRLNPMVHSSSNNALASLAGSENMATFKVSGNLANPDSYRIVAWHSDGTKQELLPYLHNMDALRTWIDSQDLISRTSGTTGIIRVLNQAGILIWQGIPSYNLLRAEKDVNGMEIGHIGDINGDGLSDIYFSTEDKAQVLFSLPL